MLFLYEPSYLVELILKSSTSPGVCMRMPQMLEEDGGEQNKFCPNIYSN